MYSTLPEGSNLDEDSIWNEKNSLMFRNAKSDRTLPAPGTLPQTDNSSSLSMRESIITVKNDGFRGNIMNEDVKRKMQVSFTEPDDLTTAATGNSGASPEL